MSDEIERSSDLMTLVDEDGVEHSFEVLDAIETDDGRYLAMIPYSDKEEDEGDEELIIVKVCTDGEGEYVESIEDESEFNHVCGIFTERLGDEFDILDEDQGPRE